MTSGSARVFRSYRSRRQARRARRSWSATRRDRSPRDRAVRRRRRYDRGRDDDRRWRRARRARAGHVDDQRIGARAICRTPRHRARSRAARPRTSRSCSSRAVVRSPDVVTDTSGGPIAGARVDAALLGTHARAAPRSLSTLHRRQTASTRSTIGEGEATGRRQSSRLRAQQRYVEISDAGAVANFQLVPGGVIEGVVRDQATHAPVANARGRCAARSHVAARRDRVASRDRGRDGKFRITGLRPGAYALARARGRSLFAGADDRRARCRRASRRRRAARRQRRRDPRHRRRRDRATGAERSIVRPSTAIATPTIKIRCEGRVRDRRARHRAGTRSTAEGGDYVWLCTDAGRGRPRRCRRREGARRARGTPARATSSRARSATSISRPAKPVSHYPNEHGTADR